ncbi:sialidase family protein [Bordetella genomosp. 11]|uniref:sialidase family protein n=1 Tax=Bordetella genomosp. 11 TaxID=1416808 RepID=UPI001140716C|nr:sialidase family protein [Bordetella genomosp. 11]
MRNIWRYQTQANGLSSNAVSAVVPGKGQDVYAAAGPAICSSSDLGTLWIPRVPGQTGEGDICVNQHSGALLFAAPACGGLGVQASPDSDPRILTREHDGLATNCIGSVDIDQAAAMLTDDILGPVAVTYFAAEWPPGDEIFNRTVSIYNVETKKWRTSVLPDNFITWRVRYFGGKVYVCTEGGLAISSDGGEHWTYKTEFKAPSKPPSFDSAYAYEVDDIHIDADGSWYILCRRDQSAWLLKSVDDGQSWEMLLTIGYDFFRTLHASAGNLFVLDDRNLRVMDKERESVKLFGPTNGLDLGAGAGAAEDAVDRFTVQGGQVFIPTNVGNAVAATADIDSYPPLWQYATTAEGLPGNAVRCVMGSSYQPEVPVLAGTNTGLAASIDGGNSWSSVDNLGTTYLGRRQINDLCYSPGPTTPYYGIATEDAGFFFSSNPLLQDVSASHYTVRDGLASDRVVCVFTRMHASMQAYLGHAGEGLSWYDGQKWRVVNTGNGLAGNYVTSIRSCWYKERTRLYVCGYDRNSTGEESAVLSFSDDGGVTWTGLKTLSWRLGDPYRLFDVWSPGYPGDALYGLICNREGHDIWWAKSVDGGASWKPDRLESPLDLYIPGTDPSNPSGGSPKISSDTRGVYISVPNSTAIVNLALNDWNYAFWQQGLRQGNAGAVFVDAAGRIYQGNGASGIALSDLAYVPFYDEYRR